MVKVGEEVNKDKPIAFIHANTSLAVEEMATVLNSAISVSTSPVKYQKPTIYETL